MNQFVPNTHTHTHTHTHTLTHTQYAYNTHTHRILQPQNQPWPNNLPVVFAAAKFVANLHLQKNDLLSHVTAYSMFWGDAIFRQRKTGGTVLSLQRWFFCCKLPPFFFLYFCFSSCISKIVDAKCTFASANLSLRLQTCTLQQETFAAATFK